jgi:hypothetical protein
MKHLFSLILGALLMVAIGVFAQTQGVTVFKPAVPKQVMVKGYCCYAESVALEIQSVVSKGWIVKAIAGDGQRVVVVYEKY